jgi:hypothetical protein
MGRKMSAKERAKATKRREETQNEKEQYLVQLKEDKAKSDAVLDSLGITLSSSFDDEGEGAGTAAAKGERRADPQAAATSTSDQEGGTGGGGGDNNGNGVDENQTGGHDETNADAAGNHTNDDDEIDDGSVLSPSGLSISESPGRPSRRATATLTATTNDTPSSPKATGDAAVVSSSTLLDTPAQSSSKSKQPSAATTATTGVYAKPAQPPPPLLSPPPVNADADAPATTITSASSAKHRYQSSLTKGKSWHAGHERDDKTGGTSTKQRALMFQQSLRQPIKTMTGMTSGMTSSSARRLEGIGEDQACSSPIPNKDGGGGGSSSFLNSKRSMLQRKYQSGRGLKISTSSASGSGSSGAPELPAAGGESLEDNNNDKSNGNGSSSSTTTPATPTSMTTKQRMQMLQKRQAVAATKKAEYVVRPEERPASIVRSASTKLVGEHKSLEKQDAVKNDTLQELAELRTKKMTKFIHAKFNTIAERNAAVMAAEEAIYAQLEARQEAGSVGETGGGASTASSVNHKPKSKGGRGPNKATSIDNVLSVVDKVYYARKRRDELEKQSMRDYREKHIHTHRYDSSTDLVSPTATSASRDRKMLIVPSQFRGAASVSEHSMKRGATGEVDDSSQHTDASSIRVRKLNIDKKATKVKEAKKREAQVDAELTAKRQGTATNGTTTDQSSVSSSVRAQPQDQDQAAELLTVSTPIAAAGGESAASGEEEHLNNTAQVEVEVVEASDVDVDMNDVAAEADGDVVEGTSTEKDNEALRVPPDATVVEVTEDEHEPPSARNIVVVDAADASPADVVSLNLNVNVVEGDQEGADMTAPRQDDDEDVPFVPDLEEEEEYVEEAQGQDQEDAAGFSSEAAIVEGGEVVTTDTDVDVTMSEAPAVEATPTLVEDVEPTHTTTTAATNSTEEDLAMSTEDPVVRVSGTEAEPTKAEASIEANTTTSTATTATVVTAAIIDIDEPVKIAKRPYKEAHVSLDYKKVPTPVKDRPDVPSGFKGMPEPMNKKKGYEYDTTCKDFPTPEDKEVETTKVSSKSKAREPKKPTVEEPVLVHTTAAVTNSTEEDLVMSTTADPVVRVSGVSEAEPTKAQASREATTKSADPVRVSGTAEAEPTNAQASIEAANNTKSADPVRVSRTEEAEPTKAQASIEAANNTKSTVTVTTTVTAAAIIDIDKPVKVAKRPYKEAHVSLNYKKVPTPVKDRPDVPSGFKGMPEPINQKKGYEYDTTCKDFPTPDKVETKVSTAREHKEAAIGSVNTDGSSHMNVRASLLNKKDDTDSGAANTTTTKTLVANAVDEKEKAIERAKEMARVMVEGVDLWANTGQSLRSGAGGEDESEEGESESGEGGGQVLHLQDFDDDVSALSLHTSRSATGSTYTYADHQYPITPRTPHDRRLVISSIPDDKDAESAPSVPSPSPKKKRPDVKAKVLNMDAADQWFTYWSDDHQREYFYNPRIDEVQWRVPPGEENKMAYSPARSITYKDQAATRSALSESGGDNDSVVKQLLPDNSSTRTERDTDDPFSVPVNDYTATTTTTVSPKNGNGGGQESTTRNSANKNKSKNGTKSKNNKTRSMFQQAGKDEDEVDDNDDEDDDDDVVMVMTSESSKKRGSKTKGRLFFVMTIVVLVAATIGFVALFQESDTMPDWSEYETDQEAVAPYDGSSNADNTDRHRPSRKRGPFFKLRNVFNGGGGGRTQTQKQFITEGSNGGINSNTMKDKRKATDGGRQSTSTDNSNKNEEDKRTTKVENTADHISESEKKKKIQKETAEAEQQQREKAEKKKAQQEAEQKRQQEREKAAVLKKAQQEAEQKRQQEREKAAVLKKAQQEAEQKRQQEREKAAVLKKAQQEAEQKRQEGIEQEKAAAMAMRERKTKQAKLEAAMKENMQAQAAKDAAAKKAAETTVSTTTSTEPAAAAPSQEIESNLQMATAIVAQSGSTSLSVQIDKEGKKKKKSSWWNNKNKEQEKELEEAQAQEVLALALETAARDERRNAPSEAVSLKDKKRPGFCYIPLAYLLSRQCRRFARDRPIFNTADPDFIAI